MPEALPISKSAYNSRPYKDAAMDAARAQSLTPEQVMALDYPGTAALAGAKIEANGDSPSSFVPSVIRRYVANQLRAELRAAFWEKSRVFIEAEVRKEMGMAEATVEMLMDGDFQVMLDGKPVEVRSAFDGI